MQPKFTFVTFVTRPGRNMIKKFRNLINKAGFGEIDFKDQMVAVKMHF